MLLADEGGGGVVAVAQRGAAIGAVAIRGHDLDEPAPHERFRERALARAVPAAEARGGDLRADALRHEPREQLRILVQPAVALGVRQQRRDAHGLQLEQDLFEVDRRLMDRGLDEEPARARELPLKQMLGPHKTQRWAKSIYF